MTKQHALVPIEPTIAMLQAYRTAIKDHIESVAPAERDRRWKTVRKRGGINGYLIPEPEKATIRYRAMVAAGRVDRRVDALAAAAE